MILADKIINERKKNGWSQEELADMLSVSRQSVSKWESAQAIPDLNKIIKLAEIFGVSTDYLLKDDIEPEVPAVVDADMTESVVATAIMEPLRVVTMEEATDFIKTRQKYMPKIALGVMMFILCPVLLLFLSGVSLLEGMSRYDGVYAGVGIIVLFLMVAFGVFECIVTGSKLKKYEYLENEQFETAYGVTGMAKDRMEACSDRHMRMVVIGVIMCILSPLPIIVAALANAAEQMVVWMVCLLLIIVACAVYLFISSGIEYEAYKMLLQEENYSREEKEHNKSIAPITGAYWTIVVAIFLAYSFITTDWNRSWIIWPVAGVLFGAVSAVLKVTRKK